MRLLFVGAAVLALAACSKTPEPAPAAPPAAATPVKTEAPAGEYKVDLSHTSLNFKVSHLGFSRYTARFTRLDGTLNFEPDRPAASSISVTIDPTSIQTNYPEPKKLNFDAQVQRDFLQPDKFPEMSFKSTKVEPKGPNEALVTGDLTLHGVTKPVQLEATFNGGYPPNAMDPGGARVGFSAHGTFKRSDFGITYGIPAPGTNMGVGDKVEVIIEAEFSRAAEPAPATPAT